MGLFLMNRERYTEAGEMFEVGIDLTAAGNTTADLIANETFALEVQPPSGSYMIIQRTTPASIGQSIINLN